MTADAKPVGVNLLAIAVCQSCIHLKQSAFASKLAPTGAPYRTTHPVRLIYPI